MAGLRSKLFQNDPALEACLVNDAAHITQGAVGDHVGKTQQALFTLDGLSIDAGELSAQSYGPSTAAAVLSFKRDRSIINRSYQTQADNIVGKMTIARMDDELFGLPPTMSDLAERDKVVSLTWAQAAAANLVILQAFLKKGPAAPVPQSLRRTFRALETHYHFSTAVIPRADYIDTVLRLYQRAINLLNNSASFSLASDNSSAPISWRASIPTLT
jgi:hypothetical protein